MPPKGSTRKTSKKQVSITQHALPLLKKPMEQIGKQVNVPGSFWDGKQSADERTTLYMCTVRDYTLAHKFPAKSTLECAWQLQEMGVSGTGSTEHGDASGDIFWMPNATFLGFSRTSRATAS